MEHKKVISSVSLGASVFLAGTVGLGNAVFAEEVATQPKEVHTETFKSTKTSEADVTKATDSIKDAKKTIENVTEELESATRKVQDSQQTIDQVKTDIQIVKNAETVIPEKREQLKTKEQELKIAIEQEEKARLILKNNQENVTTAQDAVNKVTKAIQAKTEDVKAKQDVVDKTNVTELTKAVKVQETVVNDAKNALEANHAQIKNANDNVASKEQTLRDYKTETRTTYVDPSLKAYVDNHPTNVADYKYNKDFRNPVMENVAFTGTKTVTTEITKEQYDHYKATGKFDYVVDNQQLAQSFVKLLNELRELNGVKGNIKADAEFMAYAEARANEMSRNDVLSHSTTIENKPAGEFENAYGSFGAYGQTRVENGKTIISMYKPTTHDSFAYELLLGWYSDFDNVINANYGHRRTLLATVGKKFGLAITTKPGSNGNDYTALEMQTFEPEFEYEDGEKYAKSTPESKEFWKNYTGFNEEDTLNPTFNGKKMKFIAEHTFLFTVTEIVNDQTANLQAALEQAKAKRDALIAAKPALENNVVSSTAKLSDLKSKVQNLETALANAKSALAIAQTELKALKEDKEAKLQLLTNAQGDLALASKNVEHASGRVSEVQKQLNQAKDELARIEVLQSKLPELEKSLLEVETIKDKAIETRKSIQEKLVQAQNQLTNATVEYNRVKTLYDFEKTLNLYQGDKGTLAGIPNNSPEVRALPEFDIKTLAKPEQPTNPITNTVSVKPLPTNNDKQTRGESLVSSGSKRETTNEQKTLPKTGNFSRVERQMALGGYTAFGLSLGLLGFAKRRQRKH